MFLFVLSHMPGAASILIINHSGVGEACASHKCLSLSADMGAKLALVRHALWIAPLGLINRLPHGIAVQILVERFSEADSALILNSLTHSCRFADLSKFQWDVLLFYGILRSEVVTVRLDTFIVCLAK